MATRLLRQAELERRSALLSTLVFHNSGGLSVFDADGRLSVWNEAFAKLTGIDPSLVREGANIRDLLISQARAGEFGPCDPEAEADRRLAVLQGDRETYQLGFSITDEKSWSCDGRKRKYAIGQATEDRFSLLDKGVVRSVGQEFDGRYMAFAH